MRAPCPAASLLLIAVASAAHAQVGGPRGDAQRGGVLADEVCSACHVVAGQRQADSVLTGYGPSFVAIARRPNATAQSLQNFLSSPHAFSWMPFPGLTAQLRADVIAYILSLRGRR